MIKDMKKQFSGLLYQIGFLDSTNPMVFSANYNSGISVWVLVSLFATSTRINGQQTTVDVVSWVARLCHEFDPAFFQNEDGDDASVASPFPFYSRI